MNAPAPRRPISALFVYSPHRGGTGARSEPLPNVAARRVFAHPFIDLPVDEEGNALVAIRPGGEIPHGHVDDVDDRNRDQQAYDPQRQRQRAGKKNFHCLLLTFALCGASTLVQSGPIWLILYLKKKFCQLSTRGF